jgi:hypothetical protein
MSSHNEIEVIHLYILVRMSQVSDCALPRVLSEGHMGLMCLTTANSNLDYLAKMKLLLDLGLQVGGQKVLGPIEKIIQGQTQRRLTRVGLSMQSKAEAKQK